MCRGKSRVVQCVKRPQQGMQKNCRQQESSCKVQHFSHLLLLTQSTTSPRCAHIFILALVDVFPFSLLSLSARGLRCCCCCRRCFFLLLLLFSLRARVFCCGCGCGNSSSSSTTQNAHPGPQKPFIIIGVWGRAHSKAAKVLFFPVEEEEDWARKSFSLLSTSSCIKHAEGGGDTTITTTTTTTTEDDNNDDEQEEDSSKRRSGYTTTTTT